MLNIADEVTPISPDLPEIEWLLQDNEKMIVESVEEILGYQFRRPKLLLEALTHPSFLLPADIETAYCGDYQRLEFIGDAILSFLITEYLFDWTPSLSSGRISEWRSCIVSNEFLGAMTVRAGLHNYLRHYSTKLSIDISRFETEISRTMAQSNDDSEQLKSMFYPKNHSPKALADIFESLLAAIYFDSGGIQECKDIVFSLLLQPFVLSSLIEQENQMWGVQRHPVSIIHEIAGGFGCHELKTEFEENLTTLQFNCKIICHEHILSEGSATSQTQAKLIASLSISPKDMEVFLESYCNCRNHS